MATFKQIAGLLAPDDAKILSGLLVDVNLPVDDIIKRAKALGRMGRKQAFDGAESYKGFGDEEVIKNLETLRDFVRNREVTRRVGNKRASRYDPWDTSMEIDFVPGRQKLAYWGGAQSPGEAGFPNYFNQDAVGIMDDELDRLATYRFDPESPSVHPDQVEGARDLFLKDKRKRLNEVHLMRQRMVQDMAARDALQNLFGYTDIPRSWS